MRNILQMVLLIVAVMVLWGMTSTALSVDRTVTALATVPEILTFTLTEASTGVNLGNIYPGPGLASGSCSIFSTGDLILTASDSSGGDGHMWDSGHEHELREPFYCGYHGPRPPGWPPFEPWPPAEKMLPLTPINLPAGSYSLGTSYKQAFTSGDYAGSYHITVLWTCSASF